VLKGHQDAVESVALSPTTPSCFRSADKTVRLCGCNSR